MMKAALILPFFLVSFLAYEAATEIQCSDGGFPEWKNNGVCNDENNNEVCEWDGGDCCGDDVNTSLCVYCKW